MHQIVQVVARGKDARFCFFSSSEIYGDPDPKHVPTPESYRGNVACQGPRACYDESKRLGETLCYVYHELHGVSTNTIRPFNVFGPGMQETDYRVLPNFANRIKGGRALNVYGTGRQTRTFCYVTDAMVGFLLTVLGGVPGEAYNIGNPEPEISMFDLVERIEGVLGHEVEKNLVEYPDSYPADEPNRRCPDIRKARLQLGFEPIDNYLIPGPITLKPEDSLLMVATTMVDKNIRRLPVVKNGKLVGTVARGDICKAVLK